MKNRMKIGLFMNYLINGIALIILTQNLTDLAESWHSSLAVTSYILSGVGIGRLVSYLFMGFLSDRVSRKLVLILGMISYFMFFLFTPFNHSISLAYVFIIFSGIANSALDSATYPLFTEFNPKSSANNILIKAFMSIGEFVLPLMVIFLKNNHMWFGLSFMIPTIILFLNFVNILTLKFPHHQRRGNSKVESNVDLNTFKKVTITTALLIYGYVSMAIMIWFTQWITVFAQSIGFVYSTAHFLLSLYSLGSIVGVLVTFILVSKFHIQNHWLLILNILGTCSLAIIAFSHLPILSMITSFIFGFSSAGGAMQIGLNVLLSIFPKHKGIFTSIFFLFGSLASFSVPIISGYLTRFGNQNILDFDILIGIVGIVASVIVLEFMPRVFTLSNTRKNINHIDKKIIQLLEQRFDSVEDINKLKQVKKLNIEDKGREKSIMNGIDKLTKREEIKIYNRDIFKNIINNSKEYQKSLNNK